MPFRVYHYLFYLVLPHMHILLMCMISIFSSQKNLSRILTLIQEFDIIPSIIKKLGIIKKFSRDKNK